MNTKRGSELSETRENERTRNRQMSSAWRALLAATKGTEFEALAEDAVNEIRPAWVTANTLRDLVRMSDRQLEIARQLNQRFVGRIQEHEKETTRLAFESHMQKRMIGKILLAMRDAGAEEILTLEQHRILEELVKHA